MSTIRELILLHKDGSLIEIHSDILVNITLEDIIMLLCCIIRNNGSIDIVDSLNNFKEYKNSNIFLLYHICYGFTLANKQYSAEYIEDVKQYIIEKNIPYIIYRNLPLCLRPNEYIGKQFNYSYHLISKASNLTHEDMNTITLNDIIMLLYYRFEVSNIRFKLAYEEHNGYRCNKVSTKFSQHYFKYQINIDETHSNRCNMSLFITLFVSGVMLHNPLMFPTKYIKYTSRYLENNKVERFITEKICEVLCSHPKQKKKLINDDMMCMYMEYLYPTNMKSAAKC